jgi:hypothetical protein
LVPITDEVKYVLPSKESITMGSFVKLITRACPLSFYPTIGDKKREHHVGEDVHSGRIILAGCPRLPREAAAGHFSARYILGDQ